MLLTAGQLLKVRFIYFCTVCMRLDWYLYGSIDICVSSIYLYSWIDICGSSIYIIQFDLFLHASIYFFAVLILNERVSLYLCAFNIGWTRFEDFVRNGTPYKTIIIIPFALVGYEVIITYLRYTLIGYFITSYRTRAHGIIVIYHSVCFLKYV